MNNAHVQYGCKRHKCDNQFNNVTFLVTYIYSFAGQFTIGVWNVICQSTRNASCTSVMQCKALQDSQC